MLPGLRDRIKCTATWTLFFLHSSARPTCLWRIVGDREFRGSPCAAWRYSVLPLLSPRCGLRHSFPVCFLHIPETPSSERLRLPAQFSKILPSQSRIWLHFDLLWTMRRSPNVSVDSLQISDKLKLILERIYCQPTISFHVQSLLSKKKDIVIIRTSLSTLILEYISALGK